MNTPAYRKTIALLSILCIFTSIASLFLGETPLRLIVTTVLPRLQGKESWNALIDERIPRVIITLLSGASLALSGCITQSLFQNPLASPSVLGCSFGGSLCVTLVFIFNLHQRLPFSLPFAAFLGCLVTLIFVFSIAYQNSRLHLSTLILAGIAISTVISSIQGCISYMLRDNWHLLSTLKEWENGSLQHLTWKHVHMQAPLAIAGILNCLRYHKELDILSLGDEDALVLGVDVEKTRLHLFCSIALLVGGTLASCGIISFFGLILPHILRKLFGTSHFNLLVANIIGGSFALTFLDLLLRFLGIHIFTIGNLSAVIGGLFFLFLLIKKRSSQKRIWNQI